MNKFTESAKKSTELSPVMDGCERMKAREVAAAFPNGFTIKAFDIVTINEIDEVTKQPTTSTFPVVAIKEKPVCFFAGKIVEKIITDWVDLCGGDVAETSKQVGEADVKIKMHMEMTKAGNNLMKVDIL